MSKLGNVLWFVLGGFFLGLGCIFVGLLFCLTIIGIPFGYQLIKIGFYAMCPFGREIEFGSGELVCCQYLSILLDSVRMDRTGHLSLGGGWHPLPHYHRYSIRIATFQNSTVGILPFGQGAR